MCHSAATPSLAVVCGVFVLGLVFVALADPLLNVALDLRLDKPTGFPDFDRSYPRRR